MKCPYIFPNSTYTTQDYEACAAWQDGKCRYQGG